MAPETALPREKARPLTEDKTLIQFVADEGLMKKIEKLKFLLAHQNYEGRYDKLFEKAIDMALEKLDPEQREKRREKRRTREVQPEEKIVLEPLQSSKTFFPSRHLLSKEAAALTTTSELEGPPRNRHIPHVVRDQVWVRDHGKCQYKDPITGRVCGSRYGVQFDHVKPYAQGGEHTPQNLRLLCGAHNRYRAIPGF